MHFVSAIAIIAVARDDRKDVLAWGGMLGRTLDDIVGLRDGMQLHQSGNR